MDWDHTDPQWVNDPYPIWDDLRQRCPVARTERYGGGWFPTTHEIVSAIANDTEHFSSSNVVLSPNKHQPYAPPAPIGGAPPITSDPPFHQIARRLLLPAFAPGPITRLEPYIRDFCRRQLDQIGNRRFFDAGGEYVQFIPPAAVSKLLGFPENDEKIFHELVRLILDEIDMPIEERRDLLQPMRDYSNRQIEEHRLHPRDDLTSLLIEAELNGQKLSLDHINGTMGLILVAGIDTTWSAITSALWHLATHPDDLARLVAEPGLMPLAIEEFLRFYAPVSMARLVRDDVTLFGCDMKKDDWILLGFPAANRDPLAFEQADNFIIDRAVNHHCAFGLGIHRCLGSNLARMELRIAIEEFIARYPRCVITEPELVTWSPGQVRGVRHLPVRVTTK